MRKPTKEALIPWLMLAVIVLCGCAAFVLFFEKGLPWLGTIVRYLGVLATPFILAWLVAVITRPVTHWLVRRLHFPRSLAVLLIMLLLLALIFFMFWLIIAVISDVTADLSMYATSLESHASDLIAYVQDLYDKLELNYSQTEQVFEQLFTQLKNTLTSWASQGVGVVFSVIKSTPGAFVLVLVSLVAIFYWCREEDMVRDVLLSAFPKKRRLRLRTAYDGMSNVVGGYVRAQALLILISTSICIIGFTVVGAESPLAMGLFAGVMDVIPVLGPGTLIVPWALWCMLTDHFARGVGLIVIYAVVSISRYILEPKVVGDRVGLHPLAALAAIFIGMKMFGLAGLILGPIVLAIAMAAWRSYRKSHPVAVLPEDTDDAEKNE